MFARAPSGALGQSTLDGGTPPAGPFYKTEQAACRGLRRRVKPFCNLCDSRWADSEVQSPRDAMYNFLSAMTPFARQTSRHLKPSRECRNLRVRIVVRIVS